MNLLFAKHLPTKFIQMLSLVPVLRVIRPLLQPQTSLPFQLVICKVNQSSLASQAYSSLARLSYFVDDFTL